MYKIICTKSECSNKDIFYYLPEATNPTQCGGCKINLTPKKMTTAEFNEVFDYDPFLEIPIQ